MLMGIKLIMSNLVPEVNWRILEDAVVGEYGPTDEHFFISIYEYSKDKGVICDIFYEYEWVDRCFETGMAKQDYEYIASCIKKAIRKFPNSVV